MDTYVSSLTAQITGNIVGEEEADDIHANLNDHDEGELINIVQCNFLQRERSLKQVSDSYIFF